MTVTNNIVLTGNQNNALMEVESASKAARMTFRPIDYGGLQGGEYQTSTVMPDFTNGATTIQLNLAAGTYNPIYAFRWMSKYSVGRLKMVEIGIAGNSAANCNVTFQLVKIYDFYNPYVTEDSGQTTQCKVQWLASQLRSTMGVRSQPYVFGGIPGPLADIMYCDGSGNFLKPTNSFPVGLESQPFASVTSAQKTTTPSPFFNDNMQNTGHVVKLFDTAWGDAPIEFTQAQGFHLQYNSNSGTVNCKLTVTIRFEEIPIALHGREMN